ncbi:Response regulator [Gammaproteobacteria bacterium]
MKDETIEVLLIEDDFRFAELLSTWLEEFSQKKNGSQVISIRSQYADSLAKALSWLKIAHFDIVLTDLNLPDSRGLVTCKNLLAHTNNIPVIILSGLDDEELAVQAMGYGAQDYLLKSLLDERMLLRSVRYALERHHLKKELEKIRQSQLQQREQKILDQINDRLGSPKTTAQVLGLRNLEQSQPEIFLRMTQNLISIWERIIEMRTHKVTHNVSQELKELAWQMGLYKCGPRDVVALYRAAQFRLEHPDKPRRNDIIHEEGLYLAFELMGNLVSYYRPYALGGLPISSMRDYHHNGMDITHETNI